MTVLRTSTPTQSVPQESPKQVSGVHEINMTDFVDKVDPRIYSRNIEHVAELDQIFEKDLATSPAKQRAKIISDMFEQIVLTQIPAWFGGSARAYKTSKYDDYVHGVDMVLTLNATGAPLALATDITYSAESVQDKFERTRRSIYEGTLSRVDYFLQSDGTIGLSHVPRLIIGGDPQTIREMQAGDPQDHMMQTAILLQIKRQLNAFSDYAEMVGQSEIAAALISHVQVVSDLIATKPKDHIAKLAQGLDKTHNEIMHAVDILEDFVRNENSSGKRGR